MIFGRPAYLGVNPYPTYGHRLTDSNRLLCDTLCADGQGRVGSLRGAVSGDDEACPGGIVALTYASHPGRDDRWATHQMDNLWK